MTSSISELALTWPKPDRDNPKSMRSRSTNTCQRHKSRNPESHWRTDPKLRPHHHRPRRTNGECSATKVPIWPRNKPNWVCRIRWVNGNIRIFWAADCTKWCTSDSNSGITKWQSRPVWFRSHNSSTSANQTDSRISLRSNSWPFFMSHNNHKCHSLKTIAKTSFNCFRFRCFLCKFFLFFWNTFGLTNRVGETQKCWRERKIFTFLGKSFFITIFFLLLFKRFVTRGLEFYLQWFPKLFAKNVLFILQVLETYNNIWDAEFFETFIFIKCWINK